MASLFGLLNRYFTFLPEAEITVEINPDDAGIGLFRVLKDGGVNRLSFGVQAFDDRQLTFLRRRHSAAAAERAIVTAREEGFDNVAIDLIYGVPGQTKRSWLATLEKALSFGPKHLSCYQLTTEGETPLSRMIGNGIVRPLGEEKARSLFLDTSRLLESRGFLHYEVSNYAASQEYFCRHNQKYWTHVPYLGLGPAAHSFDGKGRWWNHRSFKRYSSFVKRGEKPVEGDELLSGDQLKLERLYLGLRTSRGISIDDLPETARPALQQLKKERLVTVNGRSVQPSRLGYLVADSLPVLLS
jgi:oxygen-independent coproporphyrinogen-3 oxidase